MAKPIPYKGDETYIFVSYAHKNSDLVWPIIEQMQSEGYRVWYDEGIDPGTEWDENIARHVYDCGYFIAFLSEEYLASDNCMDEVNFARDLNKDRLLVYLTGVQLPLGMAMRLNRLQAIHWYTYDDSTEFYKKLGETKGISQFKLKNERKSCDNSEGVFVVTEGGVLVRYFGADDLVVVPDNVTVLAEGCFQSNQEITSVIIPEGVTEIGKKAFSGCHNLQQIIMPKSLQKIGEGAFEECYYLQDAYLPEGIEID